MKSVVAVIVLITLSPFIVVGFLGMMLLAGLKIGGHVAECFVEWLRGA